MTLPRAYVIPVGEGQRSASDAARLVRQLLAEFVSDERDEMHALFFRVLRTIEHALPVGDARRYFSFREAGRLTAQVADGVRA